MSAVVIYVDASVPCHNDAAHAGWGAVIVRGNAKHEASGTFEQLPGTGLCEMNAALEAIRHASKAKLLRRGDTVFVASDCSAVESYLGRVPPKRQRPSYVALATRIHAFADRRGLTLLACHVKGHNGNNRHVDPHATFNGRADSLAKQAAGLRRTDAEIARRREASHAANNAEQRALGIQRKRETIRVNRLRVELERIRSIRIRRDRAFAEMAAEL